MSTSTDTGGGHDAKGKPARSRTAGRAWARYTVVALTVGLLLHLSPAASTPASADSAECTPLPPVLMRPLTLPPAAPQEAVGVGTKLTGVSGQSGATFQDASGATWLIGQAFWYRDGRFASFDTNYRVRRTDIGSTIQQVALLRSPPPCTNRTNVATTPPVTATAAPTLRASPRPKSLRDGRRPLLRIRVSGTGTKRAAGIVKVAWRGPSRGTTYGELRPRNAGKMNLRLRQLKPGRYHVKVAFIDAHGSDTPVRTLTIRVKDRRR